MTWLTEDPTLVLLIGGVVLLILAVVVWTTGRAVFLIAMGGVALAMGGAVLIDFLVVTDRERVIESIHGAAAALESNEIERLKPFLAPSATNVFLQAKWALDNFQIEKINIVGKPKVTVNALTSPPSAVATFVVIAQGKLRAGDTVHDKAPHRLEVRLRLENGRWLIDEGRQASLQGSE